MSDFIKGFVKDERGVTAVEYALIAGLITAGLLISVGGLVTKLNQRVCRYRGGALAQRASRRRASGNTFFSLAIS